MARKYDWGLRFTAQVWNFFRRTFKFDPNTVNRKQMGELLKQRSQSPDFLKKMPKDDKSMMKRLVKDGRPTKLWSSGNLWDQMQENTHGRVAKRGNTQFLRFNWTKAEVEKVVANKNAKPSVVYSSLRELDSPHSEGAVRRMVTRARKDPNLLDKY